MKVWLAHCQDYECECIVIYDHKPNTYELANVFCPMSLSDADERFVLKEMALENIFNREISEIVRGGDK